MPKSAEVSLLAKVSHWLSDAVSHVVAMQAGLAAIEDPVLREESWHRSFRRILDAERRLALALEAYGEVVRGGNIGRAELVVAELEVNYGESRRPHRPHDYLDPVRAREHDRTMRRRLVRMRSQVERMKSEKQARRGIRHLEQEIEVLEGLTR
jgi:hypothetical protein